MRCAYCGLPMGEYMNIPRFRALSTTTAVADPDGPPPTELTVPSATVHPDCAKHQRELWQNEDLATDILRSLYGSRMPPAQEALTHNFVSLIREHRERWNRS